MIASIQYIAITDVCSALLPILLLRIIGLYRLSESTSIA